MVQRCFYNTSEIRHPLKKKKSGLESNSELVALAVSYPNMNAGSEETLGAQIINVRSEDTHVQYAVRLFIASCPKERTGIDNSYYTVHVHRSTSKCGGWGAV